MKKIAIYSRKSVFTGKGESVENQIALCKDYCEKFLRYDNADYIVYEDEDVIVVNKAKGVVVHPAPGNYTGTLVNGILYHCSDLSGINGVIRPGIVHRIDKDTSGILVIAKNDEAHNKLAIQFKDHSIKREYYALVEGKFSNTNGTIDKPLGRDKKERIKMAINEEGKRAVTHYEVLEQYDKGVSLVKCTLETGRTHAPRFRILR